MKNRSDTLRVFSGRANPALSQLIANCLQDSLGDITIADFPDGETSVQIEEDVRGGDIFIVQSTCPPVNQNLMELLIILDSFKRASASRVTVVLPYYGYARQDRKDRGRVPITAKLTADLLAQAGAHRVLVLDLHAAQIQGFFNIPVDHLEANPIIAKYIRDLKIPSDDLVVLSPDEGSIKRALSYQDRLGGGIAIVDKRRSSAFKTEQANLIGTTLKNKTVLIFDDIISTGGSIAGAAEVAMNAGAEAVYACATHAIFCGAALENLRKAPFKEIVVTDSVPLSPEKRLPNIRVLSVAPLLANAIRRIHLNQSVSQLFKWEPDELLYST